MTDWRFAPARWAGDVLRCSGHLDPDPDPEQQFTNIFRRVGEVLADHGLTWANVVDMTTYHVALAEHLEAFAAVRNRHVVEPWPAWTAVGVTELAVPGALVEVQVHATRRDATRLLING